ncbi:MAG: DUF3341 domain-containing protein [Lentisphaerae bacterium]|nr:DUF3341 domain-containing protein [Lentisphaerota bacterium]
MKAEAKQLYGIVAEFDTTSAVLAAARQVRAAGYSKLDAYAPFPVHGLDEAVGAPPRALPKLIFCGGLTGGLAGFFMQYFACVIHYPLNIGGRPFNSWPSFIPITFECTILFAALTAVLGMLALNGLPKPYQPLFAVPAFKRASQDRFFLCIKSRDPKFDASQSRRVLEQTGALGVYDVEAC